MIVVYTFSRDPGSVLKHKGWRKSRVSWGVSGAKRPNPLFSTPILDHTYMDKKYKLWLPPNFFHYTQELFIKIKLYYFYNNKLSSDRSLYFFLESSRVCFEPQGLTEITSLWSSNCSEATFRHLFQSYFRPHIYG